MIALDSLCRFSNEENFHQPSFPGKIISEEFQQGLCWNGVSPLAKTLTWKINAFFPDIELVTFWEQNTGLVAVVGVGEGQHQRTAKKNTASKILIFRDPFSTVFIKQKQLTKHNYTIDLGKKLSFCQVTHEILLVQDKSVTHIV